MSYHIHNAVSLRCAIILNTSLFIFSGRVLIGPEWADISSWVTSQHENSSFHLKVGILLEIRSDNITLMFPGYNGCLGLVLADPWRKPYVICFFTVVYHSLCSPRVIVGQSICIHHLIINSLHSLELAPQPCRYLSFKLLLKPHSPLLHENTISISQVIASLILFSVKNTLIFLLLKIYS